MFFMFCGASTRGCLCLICCFGVLCKPQTRFAVVVCLLLVCRFVDLLFVLRWVLSLV